MSVSARFAWVSCLLLAVGAASVGPRASAGEPPQSTPQAEPPAAKAAAPQAAAGPKNREFQELFGQWQAVVAEIRRLREDYKTADASVKKEIEARFNALVNQGSALTPKLLEAARAAYLEAPNANDEVSSMLMGVVQHESIAENYEHVLPSAEALIQGGYPDNSVYAWAGLAALVTNRFDLAEKYLEAADRHQAFGALGALPPDHPLRGLGRLYPELVTYYQKEWPREQKIRAAEAEADDLPRVLLVTNKGEIELELFENEAPNTVANFISLVEKGYYDGLTFHRVIPGFMAQGGCPDGSGSGGPGYQIPCECYQPDYRRHFRGTLSMAHAGRDTGGSQFFITFTPTKHLDGRHTAFGRVICGMEVLSQIQRRDPRDPNAPPADKILKAEVTRKRDHPYVPKKVGQ